MSNENKIVCKCKQNSIGNVAQRIEFFEMGGITRAEAEAIEHAKKQQHPQRRSLYSNGGSRSKKHNKKLSRSSNRKNTKLTGGRNINRNRNRNRTLNRTRTRNRTRKELEI